LVEALQAANQNLFLVFCKIVCACFYRIQIKEEKIKRN
jgi:hypothetical protein